MPSASSCFHWEASQLPCSSNVTAFEHAFALGSEVDGQGGRMLYIHPDECVDCGACEPIVR
jgi:NAD-dependent dihydropyrimidine dehydrogenase PreA subunit